MADKNNKNATAYDKDFLAALIRAIVEYRSFEEGGRGKKHYGDADKGRVHIHVESFADDKGVQIQICCQHPHKEKKELKDTPLFDATRTTLNALLDAVHLQEDTNVPEDALPQPGHYHHQMVEPAFSLELPGGKVTPSIKEITVNADDFQAILDQAVKMRKERPKAVIDTDTPEQQHVAPIQKTKTIY